MEYTFCMRENIYTDSKKIFGELIFADLLTKLNRAFISFFLCKQIRAFIRIRQHVYIFTHHKALIMSHSHHLKRLVRPYWSQNPLSSYCLSLQYQYKVSVSKNQCFYSLEFRPSLFSRDTKGGEQQIAFQRYQTFSRCWPIERCSKK